MHRLQLYTDLTFYTSYDVFQYKDMPFIGHIDISHYFGGQMFQKLPFWRMNKHFQAKYVTYSNFCTVKTTVVIQTKFGTVIKTTKYSLRLVQKYAVQIQEGRWLPS